MKVIQFCQKGCLHNEEIISNKSMSTLSIGLHGGQLLLGTKRLSERCPRCGKITVWIIEDEPQHANVEAQTEAETQT